MSFHRYPALAALSTILLAPLSAPSNGEAEEFGATLRSIHDAGIGPMMDVCVQENRAYAVGHETLFILDITAPDSPRVIATVNDLGGVRQVIVDDNHAFVTSREEGLFIIDLQDELHPRVVTHYETIEFATGIDKSGDVLFVACRHYGVELIDVSIPAKPVHLSTVRTGEAQSVVLRDGFLYAGVWASSEIVVADVHDPTHPTIVNRVPLDGYGDGVDVVGDYLYAATGHHSKERPKLVPGDPGFGHGHGLEIFKIADPARPEFVSRIKFPPFFDRGKDTWRVTVANDHAFVADSYNGVFVVDVEYPSKPSIVAHYRLPVVDEKDMTGPVGGLALVDDRILVAGSDTGLHVVSAIGLASRPEAKPGMTLSVDRAPESAQDRVGSDEARRYRPEGQVHAVDFLENDLAVIACGNAGVHIVELWPEIRRLSVLDTEGFATDITVSDNRVLVAEGRGGLSIWQWSVEDEELKPVGRYRARDQPVRQVEAPTPGRYALVQVGANRLQIIDIGDPTAPGLVLEDSRPGLLYGDQTMRGLVENRYACVFWHVSGLHWYDLLPSNEPAFSGDHFPGRIGSSNGLIAFQDKTLATAVGGYLILDRGETRPLETLTLHPVGDSKYDLGTPTIFGDLLIAAHRPTGRITLADISTPLTPRLIHHFETAGNPGRVHLRCNTLVIPDGYEGLLLMKPPGK